MKKQEKAVGKIIATLRKQISLTQAELAEKVDLDVVYLSQLERGIGFPGAKALFRLAEVLGVSAGYILDGGDIEEKIPDSLTRQVIELLDGWTPKQCQALIKALRILKEI